MKKSLWMLGVAVAALTSCTQSEVLEVSESRLIQFDSFVGKPTRATNDVSSGNFNKFHVYCKKGTQTDFFKGELVWRIKNGTEWSSFTYDTPKPWQLGETYQFAAYANGYTDADAVAGEGMSVVEHPNMTFQPSITLNDNTTTTTWGFKGDNITVGADDMIVSVPNAITPTSTAQVGNPVHFTFEHMFAKVIFRFVLDVPDGENITSVVAPFSFDAIKTADCTIYNNPNLNANSKTVIDWASQDKAYVATNWSDTDSYADGTYTVLASSLSLSNELGQDDKSEGIYVIPQNNDITVSFEAASYATGTGTQIGATKFNGISLKITGHEKWLPGYVYRYTAQLNPKTSYIRFSASVEAWKDTSDRDLSLSGSAGAASE